LRNFGLQTTIFVDMYFSTSHWHSTVQKQKKILWLVAKRVSGPNSSMLQTTFRVCFRALLLLLSAFGLLEMSLVCKNSSELIFWPFFQDIKDAQARIHQMKCRMNLKGIHAEPADGPSACPIEFERANY